MQFIGNFPLKVVTTLQIGGPAKKFVTVSSEAELEKAIDFAKKNQLNYLVIGGGSNLLVNDDGINCLVIKNNIVGIEPVMLGSEATPESKREDSGQARMTLRVKSGTPLQDLVDYTIYHGLAGLQKLTGIPGTVGGAVYGNAGAYGQIISDHLVEVNVILSETQDLSRMRGTLSKAECNFGYRDSIFKKNKFPILEVTFQLDEDNSDEMAKEAEAVLEKRLIKYPKGIKCPGSFFKNIVAETLPKEILEKIPAEKIVYGKLPAGSLLEEVGAKGDKLRDIEIASYHANLFINKGKGKAEDFYKLAQKYAKLVKEKFGIKLEPEVQLINLPALF